MNITPLNEREAALAAHLAEIEADRIAEADLRGRLDEAEAALAAAPGKNKAAREAYVQAKLDGLSPANSDLVDLDTLEIEIAEIRHRINKTKRDPNADNWQRARLDADVKSFPRDAAAVHLDHLRAKAGLSVRVPIKDLKSRRIGDLFAMWHAASAKGTVLSFADFLSQLTENFGPSEREIEAAAKAAVKFVGTGK